MEKASTIEELIAAVLEDISKKGFSSVMPFSIGRVEVRMVQFADANGIELASNELYMSAKQLQHSMRASKQGTGKTGELHNSHKTYRQERIQWQALCKDRKRPEGVYFLGDKTQPIRGSFSLLVFVIDINLRQRYEIILMIVSFRA